MQIRTYRARSLEQALLFVQRDLGPDARIVQARELQTGWLERFAKGRQFEIRTRAAAATKPLPLRRCGANEPTESNNVAPSPDGDDLLALRRRFRALAEEDERTSPPTADLSRWERGGERDASSEDGRASGANRPAGGYSPLVFDLLTSLIDGDVSPVAARELVDAVRASSPDSSRWSMGDWQQALMQRLHEEIPRGGAIGLASGRRTTIALVGPTGVGKTTTIAKLAANWRLRDRLRVALVTVDTYRVAAVEQLRTYADIMDLPMEVVSTPREMRAAVSRFSDQDVVLIDTAGRSPHDALQLQELRSLLGEAAPDEVQLVVSGVASSSHVYQTVHRFRELGATGLIITKLDEASSLGCFLPVLRQVRLPVSYLTCGQSVPDDIVAADPKRLIPALLGFQPIASLV